MGRRTRKAWFRRLGVAGAVLILLGVTMPFWFPWVLPLIAHSFGIREIHYQRYDRVGYARFALLDLRVTAPRYELRAARFEAFLPIPWAWHLWLWPTRQSYAELDSSSLRLHTAPPGATRKPGSLYVTTDQTCKAMRRLAWWIPTAQVHGSRIEDERFVLPVSLATWSDGRLAAEVTPPRWKGSASVALSRSGSTALQLQLNSTSLELGSTISLLQNPQAVRVESTTQWQSNRIEAVADFGRQGWLPLWAELRVPAIAFSPRRIGLNGYRVVQGSIDATWTNAAFRVYLDAMATPVGGASVPSTVIKLQATGDTEGAVVQSAQVTSPWLSLQVTSGTRVLFRAPYITQPGQVQFALDLERQPWFQARGKVSGSASFSSGTNGWPVGAFLAQGAGVQCSELKVNSLQLDGTFNWPWLELRECNLELPGPARLLSRGRFNLLTRAADNGHLTATGRIERPFLPKGWALLQSSLAISFHGPVTNLTHTGRLILPRLTSPKLQPLALAAEWQGQQQEVQWQARVLEGVSVLESAGRLSLHPRNQSLQLTNLTFIDQAKTQLALQRPVQIEIHAPSPPGARRAVTVSPFHWAGPGRDLNLEAAVAWPQSGRLAFSAHGIGSDLFRRFLSTNASQVLVEEFSLRAAWDNGPAEWEAILNGDIITPRGLAFSARASCRGDGNGLVVDPLAVLSRGQLVCTVQGSVPITIKPSRASHPLVAQPKAAIQLTAQTQPNAPFWTAFEQWSGVQLQAPVLNAQVGGTWGAPRGRIELAAGSIQLQAKDRSTPPLQEFAMKLVLDRDSARFEDFHAVIAGRAITLRGQVPVGEKYWASLLAQPSLPDLSGATAQLQVQAVPVAAFRLLLPKMLNPEGTVSLDLALQPGIKLAGEFRLEQGATAPLGTLGPIRDLMFKARLQEQSAALEAAGTIGGSPISATGAADLRRLRVGDLPWFNLEARGANVPLLREPEFIVRADPNLRLQHLPGKPVAITGEVTLREVLFLRDLKDLVSGGPTQPTRRPPYFSVATQPLAEWTLRLDVKGERAIKVQSPVFTGQASTHFTLTGTLKDPIALGTLSIDSGAVRFPFASLAIRQGLVSLNSANPYRPVLAVTAGAETLGYDITMQATGPADRPRIQFSSVPPLASEQLLTMLTTGQTPREGVAITGQQRAQTMAMYLGRSILSELGVGGGAGERLTITRGETYAVDGQPSYSVEYKLSPRWSVVGQYDKFNDFNLMLKWNLFAK